MSQVAIVTGAAGLIGSSVSQALMERGVSMFGIDNDLRAVFFGPSASVLPVLHQLEAHDRYRHVHSDIRGDDVVALARATRMSPPRRLPHGLMNSSKPCPPDMTRCSASAAFA